MPNPTSRTLMVALILCLSLAGCSAGSAGDSAADEPTSPVEPTPLETTDEEVEDPRALGYPAHKLPPGTNRTSGESGTMVAFRVPRGWWGEQWSDTGWLIWGSAANPRRAEAFLGVDELDLSFGEAVKRFGKVAKLDPGTPERMKIDGRPALLFDPELSGHVFLDKAFDLPIDIRNDLDTRQAFIDLGSRAMLVRIEFPKGEKYLSTALDTLRSFRFED